MVCKSLTNHKIPKELEDVASLVSKQDAISDSLTITSPHIHPKTDPRPESPLGSGE